MLKRLRENKSAQGTLLASPTMLWMLALLIIPLLLTLVVSFGRRSPDGEVIFSFSLDNYIRLLGYSTNCDNGASACFNPLYMQILWRSLSLAFNTTIWVIALAYPLAYFIARANPKRRNTYLFLVLIPLWTNFVIRVYAWMMLLRKEGAINIILGSVAHFLHIPFQPLEMLYTPGAVLVGMVYEFLPFMILPIYTSLEKIDTPLYEAAADLGANGLKTFLAGDTSAFHAGCGGRDDPCFYSGHGDIHRLGYSWRTAGDPGGQSHPKTVPGCARPNVWERGILDPDGSDSDRHVFLYA